MAILYEKVFTREFTLPWLQIWYTGEARCPKPWNGQRNTSFPYIVYVRHDDTVTSFYDMEGLKWSRRSVLYEIEKDARFTDRIRANANVSLQHIYACLKKQIIADKNELLQLIDVFQKAYPWLLALWEIGESDPADIAHLDVKSLLELKESTVTLTDDIDNRIRGLLQRIYPNLEDYSQVLTIEEIQNGNIPSINILKQRAEGFIYTDGILHPSKELKDVEKKYDIKLDMQIDVQDVSTVTGTAACLGYAKGIVHKVMAKKHMDDFKEGEILISPMTMPDFVPAMAKSAAIVTDEGGVTCHAAIIARELDKPCIVGTRLATQVFQNGDYVEVDVEQGAIRLLKRGNAS